MQAINPINTHTKFGKDRINTFPSNERKPSVRTADAGKSKNNMSTPHWGGHNYTLNPGFSQLRARFMIYCRNGTGPKVTNITIKVLRKAQLKNFRPMTIT